MANITRHYRQAIDAAWAGQPVAFTPRDVEEMQLSFSRGFSHGFLDGNNHKVLVRGDYAKKRGIFLGRVESVSVAGVVVSCSTIVKPGDGVVFDGDDVAGVPEQGGRIYEVVRCARTDPGRRSELPVRPFGRDRPGTASAGQGVWKTDDPRAQRAAPPIVRGSAGPAGRPGLEVHAEAGLPLEVAAADGQRASRQRQIGSPLAAARSRPADLELAVATSSAGWEGRFTGSATSRPTIDGRADGPQEPAQPASPRAGRPARRGGRGPAPATIAAEPVVARPADADPRGTAETASRASGAADPCPCRSSAAAPTRSRRPSRWGSRRSTPITRTSRSTPPPSRRPGAAVPRSTWPRRGSRSPARRTCSATWRSWGPTEFWSATRAGLYFCAERSIPFVADFSLNAANALTVELFKSRGAMRVTASYDLNFDQLLDLIDAVPPDLARGGDPSADPDVPHGALRLLRLPLARNRPDQLRPPVRPSRRQAAGSRRHASIPLKADVGCRNTLFNAVPQTAAEYLPRLIARGARHLRIEFLDDDVPHVERIIGLYKAALAGQREAKTLWRDLKASNQYGVTRGPLNVL